jgi:hypothetical protein
MHVFQLQIDTKYQTIFKFLKNIFSHLCFDLEIQDGVKIFRKIQKGTLKRKNVIYAAEWINFNEFPWI